MFGLEIAAAFVAGYVGGKLIAWAIIWATGLGGRPCQNYFNWRWLLPTMGPYFRWLDVANPTWYQK